MPRVLRTAAVALLLVCAAGGPSARAQEPPGEYEVKAVFLLNFAKFVAWPADAFADAHAPLVIGILGDDPFGAGIDEMARGERIGGRAIVVRRLRASHKKPNCHILFVSAAERKRGARVLDLLRGSPVLTVGESGDFVADGGVVRFTKQQYRVGFDVNLDAAARARLKISSRLLTVAGRVDGLGR